jgi:hypothetical protein
MKEISRLVGVFFGSNLTYLVIIVGSSNAVELQTDGSQ